MSRRPLWAPWRIEYVTGPKDEACIFCSAVAEPDPHSLVVKPGKRCLMLLNAYPYAPGHVMVAPHRHIAELDDLSDEESAEMIAQAREAVVALRRVMGPDGFNVGLNLGTVAGAGIADHLHLHVVPRWEGDTNFMPVLADTNVIPQALRETRDALIDAIGR